MAQHFASPLPKDQSYEALPLSGLQTLHEYIKDTEDLVTIQLDQRRNQLITIDLIFSSFMTAISMMTVVASYFGMNLNSNLQVRRTCAARRCQQHVPGSRLAGLLPGCLAAAAGMWVLTSKEHRVDCRCARVRSSQELPHLFSAVTLTTTCGSLSLFVLFIYLLRRAKLLFL
jgi:hypothetical protein